MFRLVLRNTGWNLLGSVLPAVAAIVAVPILLERLGVGRFGMLSLAWVVVGYFGLFDFGLGRAITRSVARCSADQDEAHLARVCATGSALIGVLALCVGGLVLTASPLIGSFLIRQSPDLESELLRATPMLAFGVLAVVFSAAPRGILEGRQEFRLLSLVRTPIGIASYLVPCLVTQFEPRLDTTVLSVVIVRAIGTLALLMACARRVPFSMDAVSASEIRPLVTFGGWLTVSTIISPLLAYADRFVIVSILGAEKFAYYSVPSDMVSRMLLVPGALVAALYPAISGAGSRDPSMGRMLRRRALFLVTAVVGAAVVLVQVGAEPLLRLWLGQEFARNSAIVLQILLVGLMANALAYVWSTALQGEGRSREIALLHLAQLPIYLVAVSLMTNAYGVVGAAVAWTGRLILDALGLYLILHFREQAHRRLVLAA
ncbi:MAG: flippase [Panacagrimonas sp.]